MREPRDSVRRMRPYSPPTGERAGTLRLDFNERTTPCSPQVLEALRAAIDGETLAMYPSYSDALPAIATAFGVSTDEVVLTNGTDEAIQLLVNTYLTTGDRLVVIEPSYAMYRFYAEVEGVIVDAVACSIDDDLAIPVDAIIERLPGAAALFLANPNNPTGAAVGTADLVRLLEAAGDALVLIDEAYVEFFGTTALDLVPDYPNLVVSRTFSKAYGLAGLRCGCLLAAPDIVRWLRTAQSPYSVNALAAVAAAAAVTDPDAITAYTNEVIAARATTATALTELGYRVFPSQANFLLFQANDRADRVLHHLERANIRIRDRRHELDGCLRVSIGTADQMATFVNEMRACS